MLKCSGHVCDGYPARVIMSCITLTIMVVGSEACCFVMHVAVAICVVHESSKYHEELHIQMQWPRV